MKKNLVIDSIPLLSPLTGIGRYIYEISKELEKKDTFETSYFYGYYSDKLMNPSSKPTVKSLKTIITRFTFIKKLAREIILFLGKINAKSYDLYWEPNLLPNQNIKAKKLVTTIHDFSFILHKEFHPKERIEYIDKYFTKNIIKSDMIITGSNFTKNEILKRLDFKDEQIQVIYHGINHNLFQVYRDDDLKVNFELPQKFILSVGSIEPRKNLIGLLEAYSKLSVEIKKEYKLVLAGFKGWENKEIMALIEKNQENIHYLGFISDQELSIVYNLASLFVFPSFYEGFGLPVLEAMACGTPVVCSNSSSLPEVGGDAVVYCDANNIDDITDKVTQVLNDTKLQKSMKLSGLQRAKEFTWEKSARQHKELFKKVLDKNKMV